ncbi:alpha/beta hydrolase [Niabella sp. CC-SYL272]|uniref:alpha/beta fold hydrolase n=1 Tax=Niabella agricola TaxID=2891571 RepID=UPI001F200640|nr:alpha/beta hydrolase [Niabella agricola]MCF3108161.1 alpha/beta hydrolase [Niabella agricola]
MKPIWIFSVLFLCYTAKAGAHTFPPINNAWLLHDTVPLKASYSKVNGIKMYYEIYGKGAPLVLLHGGGSTIQTTFGKVIPLLAQHRQLICVELQAHGRTEDRNTPLSFDQDADDVAALLQNLAVPKADIFGFSNGGNTALKIAIRHPQLCNRIIAGSVLLKRNGTAPQFWEAMQNARFEQMPQVYKTAFLRVTPDRTKLVNLFQRCASRMNHFTDFSDAAISSIKAPVLFINGDADVGSTEHIAAMARLVPHSQLAIIPGGHGAYIGEQAASRPGDTLYRSVIPILMQFLDGK